jgi:hypothetical protein
MKIKWNKLAVKQLLEIIQYLEIMNLLTMLKK